MFRFSCFSFAIFLAFVLAGCSQNAVPPEQQEHAANATPFNAQLAAELGADTYGMRPYVMVVLKTGPMDSKITNAEERAEIFSGHFSNMTKLAEAKKLVLSGPFIEGGEKRGLFILMCLHSQKPRRWCKPTLLWPPESSCRNSQNITDPPLSCKFKRSTKPFRKRKYRELVNHPQAIGWFQMFYAIFHRLIVHQIRSIFHPLNAEM